MLTGLVDKILGLAPIWVYATAILGDSVGYEVGKHIFGPSC